MWLRRTLKGQYTDLFSTMVTPKEDEIIASASRHSGDISESRSFFQKRLNQSFGSIYAGQDPEVPSTVYYAFKQADSSGNEAGSFTEQLVSTGWEAMLDGLVASGFCITGTWPLRTELGRRMRGQGSNALASSVVLVCRPRPQDAETTTRRQFLSALRKELPEALRHLQTGNIAPVDLAQAAIGPGMAVFTRYSEVMESDGSAMSVRTALGLINQVLDETLSEQEQDFDPDTRWALSWFEQYGHEAGEYGDAETLAKAKNVGVAGLVEAGILESRAGKVRLLQRAELSDGWEPGADTRLTIWEVTQQLIRRLEERGEQGAAELVAGLEPSTAETARELGYRLYQTCERQGWAQEARSYNALVVSWPEIERLGRHAGAGGQRQEDLFRG